jgi:uncharacterized damage-inducible protein DinB
MILPPFSVDVAVCILGLKMTEDAIHQLFIGYSSNRLRQFSSHIEKCLVQLTDEQVWARGGENENSVGNLLLHLYGNMRQWIVAGVGGEADTRRRDAEFSERGGLTSRDLTDRLVTLVNQATAVIDGVSAQRLSERLVIQGYEVSVLDAIYHVVEHFAMHTGQIIFMTKMLTGKTTGLKHDVQSAASLH